MTDTHRGMFYNACDPFRGMKKKTTKKNKVRTNIVRASKLQRRSDEKRFDDHHYVMLWGSLPRQPTLKQGPRHSYTPNTVFFFASPVNVKQTWKEEQVVKR